MGLPANFDVVCQELVYLRADATKIIERVRIVKAAVNALRGCRIDWAVVLRVVADGYHRVETPFFEDVEMLRTMSADVDADLAHRLNRFRADLS